MLTATAIPNITATGIELFKAGQQTDSKGRTQDWTETDLDEIVASYNSVVQKLHDAPILAGPAAPVQIGHESEKAYGWLTKVYREGNVLKGDYAYVDPDFAEMINGKQYRKRSISLYSPEHPSNPTPGKWNIRHVAYVSVPAVKGLADHAIPIKFNEDDGDTWEFAEEFGEPVALTPMGAIAALFQSLREQTIAASGVEAADDAYPSRLIAMVRAMADMDLASTEIVRDMFGQLEFQINELRKTVFSLSPEDKMTYSETEATDFMDWKGAAKTAGMSAADIAKATKMSVETINAIMDGSAEPDEAQAKALKALLMSKKKATADMSEQLTTLQTQVQSLTEQLSTLQAENLRLAREAELGRVTSFVEQMIADRKLLPAKKASTIELAMALPHDAAVEFKEGGEVVSKTPRDRYLDEIASNKPLYSNSNLPTGPDDSPFEYQGMTGSLYDDDEAKIDAKIRRKQQEMGQELGRTVQYGEAMLALGITY